MHILLKITRIIYLHLYKCAVIRADAEPRILSSITTLKSRLADIIEPDFGLLDELLKLEVLSRRQYDDVRSERRAAYRRSEAVLDVLTSEEQCDKFVNALKRTGQQHVANFVTLNGGQKRNLSVGRRLINM